MWLWRLSGPTNCNLQAGGQESQQCSFSPVWKPKKQGSWWVSPVPSVWLCDPMDCVACQTPLSNGSSRQEWKRHCDSLLQGIFMIQGLSPGLLHCRQILYHLNHKGSTPQTRHECVSAEDGYPSSSRQQIFNFSAFSFYSSPQWIGLWHLHLRGRSSLLHLLV